MCLDIARIFLMRSIAESVYSKTPNSAIGIELVRSLLFLLQVCLQSQTIGSLLASIGP
jgi:high-affinity K+ transport system ATPase subunit B